MRSRLIATALLAVPVLAAQLLVAAPASAATPPRPGCGFGDTNHAHQAAPGRDPLNLRPGNAAGEFRTAPPGQAPAGAGDPSGPMRGCMTDPRG